MNRPVVLFLQLPHLDNDPRGIVENMPVAAHYLKDAAVRAGFGRNFRFAIPGAKTDTLNDTSLVSLIHKLRPSIVASTLYLWNIERTLDVLGRAQKKLGFKVWTGGPEVAPGNRMLFAANLAEAAVTGEGELAFCELLKRHLGMKWHHYSSMALNEQGSCRWGDETAPRVDLADILPPPSRMPGPDRNGLAVMETSRGCPLRCTFCCYSQNRRRLTFIGYDDVMRRISSLTARGAREIRFLDPTLNSNPDFERILEGISSMNRSRQLKFFAEIRADTLSLRQAHLLKRANFADIEAGVQSRSGSVLRMAGRRVDPARVERGVSCLSKARVTTTIDIMCGLPGQSPAEVRRSIKWANGVKGGKVQFLHTLVLPGTRLCTAVENGDISAQAMPPYMVLGTKWISPEQFRDLDRYAAKLVGAEFDCPTERFAGRTLPDLFAFRINGLKPQRGNVKRGAPMQALVFKGENLYGMRDRIRRSMLEHVEREPHILWQFVVEPLHDEPLDLLDAMIEAVRSMPPHLLDRMNAHSGDGLISSRRVFVHLIRKCRYSRSWVQSAESLLRSAFR